MRPAHPVGSPEWLEAKARITAVVDQQADDGGIWFLAETAPEAYLQKELRRLHAVIEDVFGVSTAAAVCPACRGARRVHTPSGVYLECPACDGHGAVFA